MSVNRQPRSRTVRPADGAKRTLYVPPADRAVWSAAQDLAEERGHSLSSVVAVALAEWLERNPSGKARREG